MRATLSLLVFILILVLSTCGTHVSDPQPATGVSRSEPVSFTPEIAYIRIDVQADNRTWRSP